MKIEFEANNKMLGRVLYTLSKSTSYPSFSISYTVSNPEKYKNKLLENAINNSKEKAIVLANASGVKLGNILSIDYSWTTSPPRRPALLEYRHHHLKTRNGSLKKIMMNLIM